MVHTWHVHITNPLARKLMHKGVIVSTSLDSPMNNHLSKPSLWNLVCWEEIAGVPEAYPNYSDLHCSPTMRGMIECTSQGRVKLPNRRKFGKVTSCILHWTSLYARLSRWHLTQIKQLRPSFYLFCPICGPSVGLEVTGTTSNKGTLMWDSRRCWMLWFELMKY